MSGHPRKTGLVFLGVLGVILAVGSVFLTEAANRKPALVVFTANWCANCRDVIPILRDLSAQNNVALNIIDVDDPSAPSQSKQAGLTIPERDLPQVFLVDQGPPELLLDGGKYTYGQGDAVRSRILQRLQQASPKISPGGSPP